ncbi:unnamed protein product [Linum trigynum]|uniref:Uncharacterized protein n=1 Tax=Linum trigynum TaxID=586398 RepID=A0AAV2GQW3_9ROSI
MRALGLPVPGFRGASLTSKTSISNEREDVTRAEMLVDDAGRLAGGRLTQTLLGQFGQRPHRTKAFELHAVIPKGTVEHSAGETGPYEEIIEREL